MEACAICTGPHRHDNTTVKDPAYHGPMGHAPQTVCLDCYINATQKSYEREIEAQLLHKSRQKHDRLILAILWLKEGYTQKEASRKSGISTSALEKYLHSIRKDKKKTKRIFTEIERVAHLYL